MNRIAFTFVMMFLLSHAGFADDSPTDESKPSSDAITEKTSDSPVDSFYQEVDIQRFPRFFLQGMSVNQQIRCRITSKFDVYAADEKGKRKALQVITAAKLVEADSLSQAVFTQSLAEMVGTEYTFVIDAFSEVVSMTGQVGDVQAVEFRKPKTQGVLVSNVIDEDGWKELAQLTLFQPPKLSRSSGRSSRSFVRKTTHDWGSLGSWYGKTTFTGRAYGRDTKRYGFQHQLEYRPPNRDPGGKAGPGNEGRGNAGPGNARPGNAGRRNVGAMNAGGRGAKGAAGNGPGMTDLPFEIANAQFKMYEGSGEILYDTKERRVTRATEVFHARGVISATMLGLPTNVSLDERQVFTIAITAARKLSVPRSLQRESSAGSRPSED
ncbi:MAG: hypothetical protein ACR2NZ_19565 [Rubripirellula sp.]